MLAMFRTSLFAVLTCITVAACGPIVVDSATAVSGSAPNNDDAGSGSAPTIGFSEVGSDTDLTGAPDTESPTSGGPAPGDACAPSNDWCDDFLTSCWLDFNVPVCSELAAKDCYDAVVAAEPTVCEICSAMHDKCVTADPPIDPEICATGEQKCLASAKLEGCDCQPAVFPCAPSQVFCPGEDFEYQYRPGNYCAPYCKTQEDCGPESYSTCENGWCVPHFLVICWF
mgnify:CR=1 FL=1